MQTPRIGGSSLADIHAFPADMPELSDFMIRSTVLRGSLVDALRITSSLHPTDKLVTGMHVGQPLVQLGDTPRFKIILRQPGITLEEWEEKTMDDLRSSQSKEEQQTQHARNLAQREIAFCDMIDRFAHHQHGNPFSEIFRQTYALGMLGMEMDGLSPNIMVDETKQQFGLIDQFNKPATPKAPEQLAQSNLKQFRTVFKHPLMPPTRLKELADPALQALVIERRAHVNAMVDEAYNAVLRDHSGPDVKPIAFANVDRVQAVKLSDPPTALVKQLRALQNLTEDRGR